MRRARRSATPRVQLVLLLRILPSACFAATCDPNSDLITIEPAQFVTCELERLLPGPMNR
jgi:hypothetical protein